MPLYEHVFLARQDVSGQQVEALVDQFKSVIEQSGGTVGKVENWGLKTLAYRINKNRKAHFTLMNIDAQPDAVAEMERQQRLNEDVLRSLTLRVDEHEDGPSAMMQKRDDRGDRRGGRFGDRDRPRRSEAGASERKPTENRKAPAEASPAAEPKTPAEASATAEPNAPAEASPAEELKATPQTSSAEEPKTPAEASATAEPKTSAEASPAEELKATPEASPAEEQKAPAKASTTEGGETK